MSQTQIEKNAQRVEREAVEMLAAYGVANPDSKARTAAVTAIGKATPETLLDVVRTEAGPLYSDPTALAHGVAVAAAFVKAGKAATDAQAAFALRVIRAARKVNPRVALSALGYAVEGTPESEQTRSSKIGSAVRTRWSKYGKAVDIVEASREAVNAGKRHTMVSDTSALAAVTKAQAGRLGKGVDLVKIAADGGEMPTGREVSDAAGEVSAIVHDGADLIKAVERLSDVTRSLGEVTPEQWSRVDSILSGIRERLSAARKA